MAYSLGVELPLEHKIAAKLTVLIEGIADHNQEALAKEIMADFKTLINDAISSHAAVKLDA